MFVRGYPSIDGWSTRFFNLRGVLQMGSQGLRPTVEDQHKVIRDIEWVSQESTGPL